MKFGAISAILAIGAIVTLACFPALAAPPVNVEALVKVANSSDEAKSLQAIHELGLHGGAAAVAPLVNLLKAKSPTVRAYAARSLGSLGEMAKDTAPALIELGTDADPLVRREAVRAVLAIKPDPNITMPLVAKLLREADPGVRLQILQAAAEAKGAAVPRLIGALDNDELAYWACIVLRDIGPDAKDAVPKLVEKLQDRRPEIRREAILALAAIGSADAAPKIAALLKDEPSSTAATYALGVLGRIPPTAEATIKANVASPDKLLSTTSLWTLARVYPTDMKLKRAAIEQLVARLKDEDPFVRTAAARGLVALPPSPGITGPIMEKALADADETTAQYMLDAIATLGPQAVPRLIVALKHTSLRPHVAYILGQIGPPAAPASEALTKLLDDPDPNVSIEAAHALAKIGPGAKAAVPALTRALEQAEGKPAHAAALALGMIGPAAATAEPALLATIKSKDDSLSLLSAWALLQIRGPSAETAAKVLPELVIGLESPLPQSRETAAEALGRLGKFAKPATAQLQAAAKDGDEHVRKAAEKALKEIRG
ncbi:MAG: HEAT repeat domain-containing protein [Pirellulales bacterium]